MVMIPFGVVMEQSLQYECYATPGASTESASLTPYDIGLLSQPHPKGKMSPPISIAGNSASTCGYLYVRSTRCNATNTYSAWQWIQIRWGKLASESAAWVDSGTRMDERNGM